MQLDKVRAILRRQGHERLASLLRNSRVELEYYDEGTTIPGGFDVVLVTVNIIAPIDDCMALRNLADSEKSVILNAMHEVTEDRHQVIYDHFFSIDLETLDNSAPWSPTGWEQIDQELRDIEKALGDSSTTRDFQSVATRCRELLVSLAQTVFDPLLHSKLNASDVETGPTDVKRMLERYFSAELPGSSNERYRSLGRGLAKNAWDVVNATVHKRDGNYRRALLSVESSKSLINVVAIVAGRRDRVIAGTDDAQST